MKTFGLVVLLIAIWVWAGETELPYDLWFERMWPYSFLDLSSRLQYYSTPIILALLLRRRPNNGKTTTTKTK